MITDELRKRWQALADQATPGPWEDGVDDLTDEVTVVHDLEIRAAVAWTGIDGNLYSREDAEFIAAAREALPKLLDEVERLNALVRDLGGAP